MSRLSPWDCPFCGRMSAEEPHLKRAPKTHYIEKSKGLHFPFYWVVCWFCRAHGPLSGSPREAVSRWTYSADRQGAPRWS